MADDNDKRVSSSDLELGETGGAPDADADAAAGSAPDLTYAPHNILVTGGCGFIGAHVARYLLNVFPECHVVVFDKLSYCSTWPAADVRSNPRYTLVLADITDAVAVRTALTAHAIDTVLHFAAQTHVDNSFGNSLTFTHHNVTGTHVLLEACREYGPALKRFVHVSTDEVYGTADKDTPYRDETAVLQPTNPYSASKAAAEMLVTAYRHSYRLPCIITRGNNVYGPGQFPEKIVPKFALQACLGRPLTIHGDGSNKRHYIYVTDVARAFGAILCRGQVGLTYNIGVTDERSNLEVARAVLGVVKPGVVKPGVANPGVANPGPATETETETTTESDAETETETTTETESDADGHIVLVEDRKFNDFRYPVDSARLRALGWHPTTTWEHGLTKTVEWYVRHFTDKTLATVWCGGLGNALALDTVVCAHPRL